MKVLIADDDRDDWEFAALAFKEAGLHHTVSFAANGEELMEQLGLLYSSTPDDLPDLILLDLNMPKKDGRLALKEIRDDYRFQRLNVAIFSTTISEEDKAYTATLGVTRHITKPFHFAELVQTIKEVCESYLVIS
ncbi:MAG TPA: response regulator [Candidatus Kapabacteria bacterium]|nr:response regulator [Candidatus Kapabacteria bacterium]